MCLVQKASAFKPLNLTLINTNGEGRKVADMVLELTVSWGVSAVVGSVRLIERCVLWSITLFPHLPDRLSVVCVWLAVCLPVCLSGWLAV